MPQDDPHQTQLATNDQLAALYLRDRDTPCPSCNYNRRDGTTSTCPECGDQMKLIGLSTEEHAHDHEIINTLMLALIALALIEFAVHSITLADYFYLISRTGVVTTTIAPKYMITQIVNVIAWGTLLFFAIHRRRTVRNGKPLTTKRFIAPIAISLGLYCLTRITLIILYYLF